MAFGAAASGIPANFIVRNSRLPPAERAQPALYPVGRRRPPDAGPHHVFSRGLFLETPCEPSDIFGQPV